MRDQKNALVGGGGLFAQIDQLGVMIANFAPFDSERRTSRLGASKRRTVG